MQTIGERLEEARKKKGISIREAAEATKIRGDYLQQFENNRFDVDLTEIYVRGFLRSYASFLKLPSEKILNDYSSLGRGEPRARQPSREIYGRMDVSIASADDREESESTTPETPAPQPARRQPPAVSRGSNALPGPALDPALVYKGGIALVALLVLFLVAWGIKSLVSSGSPERATKATAANVIQPASEPSIMLIALDTVRVKVVQESDGKELFQGTLVRGETRSVPKHGALFITASAGENLEIEVNGKRYPMPFKGWERAKIN